MAKISSKKNKNVFHVSEPTGPYSIQSDFIETNPIFSFIVSSYLEGTGVVIAGPDCEEKTMILSAIEKTKKYLNLDEVPLTSVLLRDTSPQFLGSIYANNWQSVINKIKVLSALENPQISPASLELLWTFIPERIGLIVNLKRYFDSICVEEVNQIYQIKNNIKVNQLCKFQSHGLNKNRKAVGVLVPKK